MEIKKIHYKKKCMAQEIGGSVRTAKMGEGGSTVPLKCKVTMTLTTHVLSTQEFCFHPCNNYLNLTKLFGCFQVFLSRSSSLKSL